MNQNSIINQALLRRGFFIGDQPEEDGWDINRDPNSMSGRSKPLIGTLLALVIVCSSGLLVSCRFNQTKREPIKPNQEQLSEEQRMAELRLAERLKSEKRAAGQKGWIDGHRATVACLHGERAQTDGNELRCEEPAYVRDNYTAAATP